jgi:hypothetical protein
MQLQLMIMLSPNGASGVYKILNSEQYLKLNMKILNGHNKRLKVEQIPGSEIHKWFMQ